MEKNKSTKDGNSGLTTNTDREQKDPQHIDNKNHQVILPDVSNNSDLCTFNRNPKDEFDFLVVRQFPHYVDKTLLIKDVINLALD